MFVTLNFSNMRMQELRELIREASTTLFEKEKERAAACATPENTKTYFTEYYKRYGKILAISKYREFMDASLHDAHLEINKIIKEMDTSQCQTSRD